MWDWASNAPRWPSMSLHDNCNCTLQSYSALRVSSLTQVSQSHLAKRILQCRVASLAQSRCIVSPGSFFFLGPEVVDEQAERPGARTELRFGLRGHGRTQRRAAFLVKSASRWPECTIRTKLETPFEFYCISHSIARFPQFHLHLHALI